MWEKCESTRVLAARVRGERMGGARGVVWLV